MKTWFELMNTTKSISTTIGIPKSMFSDASPPQIPLPEARFRMEKSVRKAGIPPGDPN